MQILTEKLFSPLSYSQYLELFAEEKILKMPGHLQDYTRLNAQRMHRWEKTYEPSLETRKLLATNSNIRHAFIITEPWCGDAAHCIPAIQKLLSLTPDVSSPRYILRDTNIEVMDMYLTNGKRSIPILILTDSQFHVLGQWGPRPAPSQVLVDQARQDDDGSGKWKEKLQIWYNQSKQIHLESELLELIRKCNAISKNC